MNLDNEGIAEPTIQGYLSDLDHFCRWFSDNMVSSFKITALARRLLEVPEKK
jgi:hypothetical protein